MRINKQAVLDKIEAYYQQQAQAAHDRQVARVERWDRWAEEQRAKKLPLAAELRALANRVDGDELLTVHDIDDAVRDLAHNCSVPYAERRSRTRDALFEHTFPKTRPEIEPVEPILARLRTGGRFTDLLGVLENMVGDDVAISSLQKLGVLDAEDARLLFKASRAPERAVA